MKNIKVTLLTILLTYSCLSCSDFLVENPKDFISPSSFYNTEAEAIGGAIGCYKLLTNDFDCISNSAYYVNEIGTDIQAFLKGRELTFPIHIYTLSTAQDAATGTIWLNFYRGIDNANNLLEKVGSSAGITPTVKAQILAEGYFYRAYYYYYLTSYWGDVPYFDKLDIAYATSGVSRTSASTIRKNMIADLEANADNLPTSYSQNGKGRPTKWAAKVLLCKFYLWEKQWSKCSALCQSIISSSPHKLVKEYADLWGLKNEYNSESIWEMDYDKLIYPTVRSTQFCPRGVDEKSSDPALQNIFTGYGLLTAAPEFLSSFEAGDKRRIFYRWLDGDPRVNFNLNYVSKFLDLPADMVRGVSGINIGVYRLADVYLMLAESENELNNNPTPLAYSSINLIRARAGLPALSGLDKNSFFDAIFKERKWELAFENGRKIDLCRWNKLVDAVKTMTKSNALGVQNVDAHFQLLPIPIKEIQKNSKLTQNPGY